jgi:hypothetical protein
MYINNEMPGELTQRDSTNCAYVGTSGGSGARYGDVNYEAAYLQQNNEIKSSTINNRPNQGGTQVFNQQMNVSISRQDSDRYNGRFNPVSSLIMTPPSKEIHGKIQVGQYYNECNSCERIEPSILNAFRSNPYTHSLTGAV